MMLTSFAIALGVVLLVELPDKTLVATLVLSTRYRVQPVLLGVSLAFAVQCVIASVAGGVITVLPHRVVEAVVAVLFAIGAALLIREFLAGRDGGEDVELADRREDVSFARVAATSFGVLFAAEWGDASQIATAGLVARHHGVAHAVATGLGAWVALVLVAAIATVVGRSLVRRVPLHLIHGAAGMLFGGFAVVAAVAAIAG